MLYRHNPSKQCFYCSNILSSLQQSSHVCVERALEVLFLWHILMNLLPFCVVHVMQLIWLEQVLLFSLLLFLLRETRAWNMLFRRQGSDLRPSVCGLKRQLFSHIKLITLKGQERCCSSMCSCICASTLDALVAESCTIMAKEELTPDKWSRSILAATKTLFFSVFTSPWGLQLLGCSPFLLYNGAHWCAGRSSVA